MPFPESNPLRPPESGPALPEKGLTSPREAKEFLKTVQQMTDEMQKKGASLVANEKLKAAAFGSGAATTQGDLKSPDVGLENHDQLVDKALGALILEQARAAFQLKKKGYFDSVSGGKGGFCEQYADYLKNQIKKSLGFDKDGTLNWEQPLNEAATADMRGKILGDLSVSDFSHCRAGNVFFVNLARKYTGKNALIEGTSDPLPKISDERHWFTFVGIDNGVPRFVDNLHETFTLADLQKSPLRNRAVINIHDPYADVRDNLQVNGNMISALDLDKDPEG